MKQTTSYITTALLFTLVAACSGTTDGIVQPLPDEDAATNPFEDASPDVPRGPDAAHGEDTAQPVEDAPTPRDTSDADDAALPDVTLDTTPDVPLDVPPMEDTMEPLEDVVGDVDPNIGEPCQVGGREGTCLDVSDCTGDNVATPGFCPGDANIQCCTPQVASSTCDPDAMPSPNTGLTQEPGEGGCPDGMVPVTADLCIDRYEASLVHDGSPDTHWSPYHNPGAADLRAVSLPGAVPQGYINQVQATNACVNAGKRLCSNDEWLRACQGQAANTYPYGATRQDGTCNDARARHPAVEYFMSAEQWVFSMIQHSCLNQLADGLATTGDHPGCVTGDGAFDMMGNLHEWTSDPAGTFRGGFYVDTYRNGEGCLYRTTAHDVNHWDYSTGFRCCADR